MLHEFELGMATDILIRELFRLEKGETFVITADTESDPKVVNATARTAFAAGARPMVIWTATPLQSGKAAEPMLPAKALTAVLLEADAWVEFNGMPLLYSSIYDTAMKKNKNLRHLCLLGMHVDMMTRCIGRIDYPTLSKFQDKVAKLTEEARHVRITSPAGNDVQFDNNPSWPVINEKGYADKPGSHMLSGQIGWSPVFDSIKGAIVFDGSVSRAGLGRLRQPIRLWVEKGEIVRIEGGDEAARYEQWLRGFNDAQMLKMAHVCFGFNPNAKLSGYILEDERIWGCTEWGIGNVGPMLVPPDGINGASHSDGICLDSSVWFDDKQITDKGKVVHKDLVDFARKLGRL
jgi:leucyl aminopeptidase (aminopeptidase T)